MKPAPTPELPALLVEDWVERAGLSFRRLAGAMVLLLLCLLLVAAYLDGVLDAAFNLQFWRSASMYPGIIAYILWLQPPARRLRDAAILALRPLVPVDDEEFYRLVASEPLFDRRGQVLGLVFGALALLLFRPWQALPSWLMLWQLLAGGLMFGLLGWVVYTSLVGNRLGADWQISEEINVFELQRLEPIARWSLGSALAYIGGITLSLLFIGRFTLDLAHALIYGVLTLAALVVFFSNMRNTHHMMVQAKDRELGRVSRRLAALSEALRQGAEQGRSEEMMVLVNLSLWRAYEKQVGELPEWPYTDEIRRNLLASMLLPLAAYIVPALLLQVLQRWLST
jgi:hypothetical protein